MAKDEPLKCCGVIVWVEFSEGGVGELITKGFSCVRIHIVYTNGKLGTLAKGCAQGEFYRYW